MIPIVEAAVAAVQPFFKGLSLLSPDTKEVMITAALCYKKKKKQGRPGRH